MLPVIQVGPLALQAPGLLLLAGLWFGLLLAERNAHRFNVDKSQLYNLSFVALIAGVVSARLVYALHYLKIFIDSPVSLISLNPGLLNPWGGLAIALVAVLVYGRSKKLAFWSTLDALTLSLAVISIGIGLSHIASGSAYGTISNIPWGIKLWGAIRHPAQIYETLAAVLILALILPWRRLIRPIPAGIYFLRFIALSATARLFLEAFRGDSHLLPGGVRTAQVVAWLVLGVSLWGIIYIEKVMASPPKPQL